MTKTKKPLDCALFYASQERLAIDLDLKSAFFCVPSGGDKYFGKLGIILSD